jgi:hypothetical protein
MAELQIAGRVHEAGEESQQQQQRNQRAVPIARQRPQGARRLSHDVHIGNPFRRSERLSAKSVAADTDVLAQPPGSGLAGDQSPLGP